MFPSSLTQQILLSSNNRRRIGPNSVLRLQQQPIIDINNIPSDNNYQDINAVSNIRNNLRPVTLEQHIKFFNKQKENQEQQLPLDVIQEVSFTEGAVTRMVNCLEKNKNLSNTFSSYMEDPTDPEKFLNFLQSTDLGIELSGSNKDLKPLLKLQPIIENAESPSVFSVLCSTLNFINFQTDGWSTYVGHLHDSLKDNSHLKEECNSILEGFYAELHSNLPFILYMMGIINETFYSSLDVHGIRMLVNIVTSSNFYELADKCGSVIIKELFISCNSIKDLISKIELYGINTQSLISINANTSDITEGEISEEQKEDIDNKQKEIDKQKNYKNDLKLVDFLISLLGIDLNSVWPCIILLIKYLTGVVSTITFIYAVLAILIPLLKVNSIKIPPITIGQNPPVPDKSIKDLLVEAIKKFLKKNLL